MRYVDSSLQLPSHYFATNEWVRGIIDSLLKNQEEQDEAFTYLSKEFKAHFCICSVAKFRVHFLIIEEEMIEEVGVGKLYELWEPICWQQLLHLSYTEQYLVF